MPAWQLALPWLLVTVLAISTLFLIWSRRKTNRGIIKLTQTLSSNLPARSSRKPYHLINRHLGELADLTYSIKNQTGNLQAEAQSGGRFFQSAIQELSDGLILVSSDLTLRFFNKKAEELFPRFHFAVDSHLIEVCGNESIVRLVQKSIAKKKSGTKNIQLAPHPSQSSSPLERHFTVETAPLGKKAGGGAWILIRDISEQIQTEQVRKDFVANASHELRTPLTIINGYIENLQEGVITDPEFTQRALEIMGKHGDRLGRIIEDMLTVSKLESGPKLHLSPFDFGDCAAGVIENIIHASPDSGIRLLASPPAGSCPMIGDQFFWDQILVNLLANAIKENPSGVGIGISWTATPTHWKIRVWDDGIGIPSAHLPYIFKRFYRVEKHHSQSHIKGTGLGLSIVKRAVEAQGGKIRVESIPGERTEFFIDVSREVEDD